MVSLRAPGSVPCLIYPSLNYVWVFLHLLQQLLQINLNHVDIFSLLLFCFIHLFDHLQLLILSFMFSSIRFLSLFFPDLS